MKVFSTMSILCILLAVVCCGCEVTTYVKLLPVTTGIIVYSPTAVVRTRTNSQGEQVGFQEVMIYSSTTISSISWDLQTFTSYLMMVSSIVQFVTTTITTVTNPEILITLASTTVTIHAITTTPSATAVTLPFTTIAVTWGTLNSLTDTVHPPQSTSTLSSVSSIVSTGVRNFLTSSIATTATIPPSASMAAEKKPTSRTVRILSGVLAPVIAIVTGLFIYILIYRKKKTKDGSPLKENTAFVSTPRPDFPSLSTPFARHGNSTTPVRPPRPESLAPSVIESMKDPQINALLRKQNDRNRSSTATRLSSSGTKGSHRILRSDEASRAPDPPSPHKALMVTVPYPDPGPADVVLAKKIPKAANTSQSNDMATRKLSRHAQLESRELTCSPVELEAEQILVARISTINAENERLERAKALAILEGRRDDLADDHSISTSSVYSRGESEYQNAFEKRAEEDKRERDFYQGRSHRPSQVPKEVLEGGNGFF